MERQHNTTKTAPAKSSSNDEEHNATSTASTTGTATNSRGAIKYRRQRSSSFFDSTRQVTITLGGDDDDDDAAIGLDPRGGTAMSRSAPKDRVGILSFSPSRASGTVVVTPADAVGSTTTTSALPFLPIASSDHGGVGGVPNSPGGAGGDVGATSSNTRERRRMTSLYDMSSTMNRLRSSLVGYVEPPPSRPTPEGTSTTTMTEIHHGSPHLPVPGNVDSPHRRHTTITSSNLHKNDKMMTLETSSQTASRHSNDGTGTYGSIPLVPLVHDSRLPTMLHPSIENGKQPTRTDGNDADADGVNPYYSSTAPTTDSTTTPGPEDGIRSWRKKDDGQNTKCFTFCRKNYWWRNNVQFAMGQIPAVIIMGLFHLMIGIPFGVSYFPIGWSSASTSLSSASSDSTTEDNNDSIHGPFPLPGKEALGIRMFLFSTMIGQIVFTYRSQFHNPIGLQMVENVPFCHALSVIVIQHVGYGTQALSTLVVMFGLSSIIVGFVFYILGYYKLGRIIYFFPTHVLVGCIGGIGLFIAKTGIEVTINRSFNPFMEEFWTWSKEGQLWGVVLLFEITLRLLERITKHQYSLLGPIYFLCITPIFYIMLLICNIPMSYANDVGYFFPSLDDNDNDKVNDNHNSFMSIITSLFHDETLWDYWHVVDFRTVSWKAILDSTPTLIALTLFSLIHVPINIPAFAISSNTEVDMNNELVAHGYSNALSGVCGGLQNYMAYTQSVLYDKSKGTGKGSGIAVAFLTGLLFVIGPKIASYIPKCMAGTLLLHVGIDLFLEGVYDSYSKFDKLEYGGIWCIAIVMTLYGMDAAMMTGVIAAVSTYAVQNITYLTPIRGHMSATTLRSSQWNRNQPSQQILDSPTVGRCRILVVQLQGHLFFGNMAHLTESLQKLVVATNKKGTSTNDNNRKKEEESSSSYWWIVILDLSLVLGIDSSAAQAIIKLKTAMLTKYHIPLIFFVSGSRHGFPCEINLTKELSTPNPVDARHPARQHHPSPSTANGSSNKKKVSSQSKKKKGNDVGSDSPVGAVMVQSSSDAHFDTSSTLRRRISQPRKEDDDERSSSSDVAPCIDVDEETALLLSKQEGENNETIHGNGGTSTSQHHDPFSGSYVCESLDAALLFAENALIAKQDPNLLEDDLGDHHISLHDNDGGAGGGGGAYPWLSYRGNAHPKSYSYRWDEDMSLKEEREVALHYLTSLCRSHALSSSSSSSSSNNNVEDDMKELFMHFERQVFYQDDYLWKQGDVSDSCKLIIRGDLIALLENEAGTTEYIACGNVIGEFGLVSGSTRMTSVQCLSPRCIIYSLPKQIFDDPNTLHPRLARFIDQLCVLYLGNRVQHVSNRIFETRCLPI